MDTMAMRRSSATAVPTTSTTRPPKETGLHEVFRARSYLNFIDQDPSNDVARTILYKALEGFEEGREATRSEIWFGGPETFEKILLMRRQRWERDQEEEGTRPSPDRGKVAAQVDGGMSGPTNV